MKSSVMDQLKHGAYALGLPGVFGLIALVLATGLVLLRQGWDERSTALQAEADQLGARLRAHRAAGGSTEQPLIHQAQWLAALPSAAMRQQRLADLLEIGLSQGLQSSRTEHRLVVDASAGLERLRVSMPVSGSYAQVRGMIEAALRHDRALSLDSLKLRRASSSSNEVEAELSWSLHGRSDAPSGVKP